jgi:hypothetical protein
VGVLEGGEYRLRTAQSFSQIDTFVAILLNLLSTTRRSCSFLDLVTAILLDLAYVVLAAMISGSAGAVIRFFLPQQFLSLVPDPAELVGDDLGGSGGGVVAFHFHNGSSDLSLVLLGGEGGADVEDLLIFSLVTCNHLVSIFLLSWKLLGSLWVGMSMVGQFLYRLHVLDFLHFLHGLLVNVSMRSKIGAYFGSSLFSNLLLICVLMAGLD